jgi:hypothetical protein
MSATREVDLLWHGEQDLPHKRPGRELEILHVHGSDSSTLLLRSATVTVEPGVLPNARFNPAPSAARQARRGEGR